MTDTSDLVERLRNGWVGMKTRREAADAIERLEGTIEAIQAGRVVTEAALAAKDAEIARLEAELEVADDQIANLKALLPYHEYKGQDA